MSGMHIDEKSIVAKVDQELKKGGTFDKLRKQTMELIKESEIVKRIEKEMLEKADELVESSQTLSRDEILQKMRQFIESNPKVRNDINRQTRSELDKAAVQQTLKEEIEKKVTKQLEDMV